MQRKYGIGNNKILTPLCFAVSLLLTQFSLAQDTAPTAFGIEPDSLEKIKGMPVIFIHGAADEVVPVDISHRWVEKAKELNMTYEFNEMEGISHSPVIMAALPSVYEFFSKHSKSK